MTSKKNCETAEVIPNSHDPLYLNEKLIPDMVNLFGNKSGLLSSNTRKFRPTTPDERTHEYSPTQSPKSIFGFSSEKTIRRLNAKTRAFKRSMLLWGNNTTIHGISEIVSMSTLYLKLIWLCFLLLALAFLSFQIYRLAIQFSSNPTATRMGTTEITHYPPSITYCTNRAIDHEVVSKYGLNEYAIIDLMTTYFGASKLFVSESTVAKIIQSRSSVHNIFEALNMTHFDDLMEALTRSPDMLFSEPQGVRTVDSIRKVGTRYGPCYKIEFTKPKQRTYGFGSFQVFVKRPEIAPFIAKLFHGTFTKDEIYFVTFGDKLVPYNIDGNSDATVKATYRKRFSTPHNPCLYDDENPKDVKLCQDECENERMKKCFGCIVYSNTSRVNEFMCGFLEFQDELLNNVSTQLCYEQMDAVVEECNKNCMNRQPCHDWIFDVFVLPRQFRDIHEGNSTVGILTLTVHEPYASLFMEEYYTYPLEQFVSDLGGQLGLFFGASVLSVLQLAYFCCCLPTDKESIKDDEDEIAKEVQLAAMQWCKGLGLDVKSDAGEVAIFDNNCNNSVGKSEDNHVRFDAHLDDEDFDESVADDVRL